MLVLTDKITPREQKYDAFVFRRNIYLCFFIHRSMQFAFEGLFPRDNPKNTRFAINFFTSIGLGGLTWVDIVMLLFWFISSMHAIALFYAHWSKVNPLPKEVYTKNSWILARCNLVHIVCVTNSDHFRISGHITIGGVVGYVIVDRAWIEIIFNGLACLLMSAFLLRGNK